MIEKLQDDYKLTTYRDAVDSNGDTIEVVDNVKKITMTEIDTNITNATSDLAYWDGVKSDAEEL